MELQSFVFMGRKELLPDEQDLHCKLSVVWPACYVKFMWYKKRMLVVLGTFCMHRARQGG